jgi:hypothetical protein
MGWSGVVYFRMKRQRIELGRLVVSQISVVCVAIAVINLSYRKRWLFISEEATG